MSVKPATPAPGATPTVARVDELVLTASNASQARGYEAELAARQAEGQLVDLCDRWRVVPDPGGHRVGSGGSTLHVLAELARTRARTGTSGADPFDGRRILIIHSGGDSRRLPAYAASGKIFMPLPFEDECGRVVTMFDLVARDLANLHWPREGRVLVASGDVYLGLSGQGLDLSGPGVVGVAFATDVDRGSRHGVYVCDERGRVADFLQKPSAQVSQDRGAILPDGRVLVDTGVVSLAAPAVRLMLAAAGVDASGRAHEGLLSLVRKGLFPAIDLYEHVLMALAPRIDEHGYVARLAREDEHARSRLVAFRAMLAGMDFSARTADRCEFLHVGTTRELLALAEEAKTHDAALRSRLGLDRGRARHVGDGQALLIASPGHRVRSVASDSVSWVEACAPGSSRLGGANVVVGLARGAPGLDLPAGVGVVALPIGATGWALVHFGDGDDFKTPAEAGGTFLNRPMTVDAGWWAPDVTRTLWNARLWTIGAIAAGAKLSAWMREGTSPSAAWLKTRKHSLAELVRQVNHHRAVAHRAAVERATRVEQLVERAAVLPWLWSRTVRDDLAPLALGAARAFVAQGAKQTDPLTRARTLRLAHVLAAGTRGGGTLASRAAAGVSRAVADVVAREVELPTRAPTPGVLRDQVVWVTCPARIDLAGGWSDTPPICQEVGGSVVNAAVTINGQYPVQVIARLADRPGIRLSSVDLGETVTIANAATLRRHNDPTDWATLPKAAMVLSGLAPPGGKSLSRWLSNVGGVDLTVFSALPKGSGLGTSSILGAAVLAALARLLGEDLSVESLIRRTSLLEQLMSTGGGWQDQAGGVAAGVKLLTTQPGREQTPRVIPIVHDGRLATPEARSRMLLFFTGQRRLAKNILQNVVNRWLDREPAARRLVDRLKAGAAAMHDTLSAGDLTGFARGVREYWELKKQIDPGSTNPALESLIRRAEPFTDGLGLAGAGGGGFLFLVAKDESAALKLRAMLSREKLGRLYEFAIDGQGLRTNVL